MTIASLGIEVNSGQAAQGAVDLNKLEAAAKGAEAATGRLRDSTGRFVKTGSEAAATARQGSAANDGLAASNDRVTATTRMQTAAIQANNTAMRMASFQRTNLIFQLNDIGVSLASGMNPLLVAIQQGSQIATIYGPGEGGIGKALRETGAMAGQAASKFAPLGAAVGAATLLLYGFTRQINEANNSNVSMVDTALAMWESLASAVQTTLGPAITWLSDEFNRAVDQITSDTAREMNVIIGLFVGTVEAIKEVWGVLPDAIGYIMFEVSRSVSNAIVQMQKDVMASFNAMFSNIDNMALKMGGKAFLPRFDVYQYGKDNFKMEQNPYGSAEESVDAAGAAFNDAMGEDYVGDWMGGVGNRAQEIAAARKEAEGLGGAAKAANDNVKKLADDGMTKAFDVAKSLQDAFHGLGKGIFDAFKKGGDVAGSVLDMLMGKLEQFATSWLDNIINNGIDALFGSMGGFGMGSGMAGTSSITGSSGGYFPGFANGTNSAPGGMAWVGERGPELVNLPRGSQVFDHSRSIGMAANQNRPISVQTNIINNAGVEVIENTVDDGQGGVRQEITLNRAVAQQIAKPGAANSAVRGVGRLVRR